LAQGYPLDFDGVLIQYRYQLLLPNEVHSTLFEDVMKWAYLDDLDLCLPEAFA